MGPARTCNLFFLDYACAMSAVLLTRRRAHALTTRRVPARSALPVQRALASLAGVAASMDHTCDGASVVMQRHTRTSMWPRGQKQAVIHGIGTAPAVLPDAP